MVCSTAGAEFVPLEIRSPIPSVEGAMESNRTRPIPPAVSLVEQVERFGRALPAQELADILNVSKITVSRLAESGYLSRIGTC
jgi:hypothetical protein